MIAVSQAIRCNRASGDGDFTAILDGDGVFEIVIRGVWSAAQVDRFFAAIMPLYHSSRAQHGRV